MILAEGHVLDNPVVDLLEHRNIKIFLSLLESRTLMVSVHLYLNLICNYSFRVEFMSKFYSGLGHPFQPFCFKGIMDSEEPAEG